MNYTSVRCVKAWSGVPGNGVVSELTVCSHGFRSVRIGGTAASASEWTSDTSVTCLVESGVKSIQNIDIVVSVAVQQVLSMDTNG